MDEHRWECAEGKASWPPRKVKPFKAGRIIPLLLHLGESVSLYGFDCRFWVAVIA